jgi:uncharacterized Ntn-hydrolase superfamily protein
MIKNGNYSPHAEDFTAAGITDQGGDRYQQAAAFFRQGMILKNSNSFNNIALMIEDGNYSPYAEDFNAAGMTDPGGNRYQQAAAFYRQAMIHKVGGSFHNIVCMIRAGFYSPRFEDFNAAGITDPGGDRYQQSAAFIYQMYLCCPDRRTSALANLNEIVDGSLDKKGHTHLMLLRLYLLHENDLKNASRCLKLQPDKNKAIESLTAEIVKQLVDPKLDLEHTQTLLNFVIDHGAAKKLTSSGATSSFFSQNEEPVIQPELERIATIISRLKNGNSLMELFKEPEIQADLPNYPMVAELIKAVVTMQIDEHDKSFRNI